MKKKRLDISRCLSPQYWASCTFNRGAATPPTAYGFVLVGSVDPKQKSDEDAIYIRGRATPLVEEVINNMNCWQAPVFHADRKSHAGMEHLGQSSELHGSACIITLALFNLFFISCSR